MMNFDLLTKEWYHQVKLATRTPDLNFLHNFVLELLAQSLHANINNQYVDL